MSVTESYRPPETVDAVPARESRRGSLQRVLARLDAAYAAEGLTLAQKAVLVALVRHADDLGECHPQADTLALLVSSSVRTVRRALDELESLGYFTRLRGPRGYRYLLSATRLGLVADRSQSPVAVAALTGHRVQSQSGCDWSESPLPKGGIEGVGLGQDPPPPAAEHVIELEEETPTADEQARVVVAALRPHTLLAGHVAPLRAAIAGAITRGVDPGRLQVALAAKLRVATGLGLLVALARAAEAGDYPPPEVRPHFARGELDQADADVGRHHSAPGAARQLRATEEARRAGAPFSYLTAPPETR